MPSQTVTMHPISVIPARPPMSHTTHLAFHPRPTMPRPHKLFHAQSLAGDVPDFLRRRVLLEAAFARAQKEVLDDVRRRREAAWLERLWKDLEEEGDGVEVTRMRMRSLLREMRGAHEIFLGQVTVQDVDPSMLRDEEDDDDDDPSPDLYLSSPASDFSTATSAPPPLVHSSSPYPPTHYPSSDCSSCSDLSSDCDSDSDSDDDMPVTPPPLQMPDTFPSADSGAEDDDDNDPTCAADPPLFAPRKASCPRTTARSYAPLGHDEFDAFAGAW